MYSFQHAGYFYLLLALPIMLLLFFYLLNWKKKAVEKIGDKNRVQELIKNYSPQRFACKFILLLIAFTAGVLALVNVHKPIGSEKITQKGVDVVVALDVSKSMLAGDIQPSRLDRAKQMVSRLIDRLANDRIGLVVFAGRAYLQMPLTIDHESAKMFVSTATPDAVPTQGTVISDALKMCAAAFNSKEKKFKAVILITDGENHDEGADELARKMAGDGIIIYTVGIGSKEGTTFIDPTTNELQKDENGNTVVTKLNESALMQLAKKGNGTYQFYTNTEEVVTEIKKQLNAMDQKEYTANLFTNYKSYFYLFLFPALLLLIWEVLLSEKKKAAVHKISRTIFVGVLFLIPAMVLAQDEKKLIKKGNEAYAKNKFNQAITHYQAASKKNPNDVKAHYNMGNALYRDKKTKEAIEAYDGAINKAVDPADKARAFYNKGVALQNNNKLEECIDAYKNALKITPGDDDARQNLQKALQQKKKQEQKQQQEQKPQKPKKENEQEKKQPGNDKKEEQPEKPKEEENKKEMEGQLSTLSKQEAEEKLKALAQHEKELQEKLRKNNISSQRPTKDW